ncbi:MAG: ATP synthase F0 subunit B [Patescibacteria group bacterium]
MDIQFPQILFQMINFGVVAGALYFLLGKPVKKIFDERSEKIREGQEAAEKAIENQKKLELLEKKIKQEAEKKAAELLKDAQADAKKTAALIVEDAKLQAKKEIAKLKQDWQAEQTRLMLEAKSQLVEAVVEVSKKVIGLKLDAKTDGKMIEKELDLVIKNI